MRKYKGTYRVLCERDINGDPTDEDFTYLVGTGNNSTESIHRYDKDILSLFIVGENATKLNNMVKRFEDNNIEIIERIDGDCEGFIRFNEKHIDKVCDFIKCKTSGANTPPESLKNHPRGKEIKQEKFDALPEEEKLKRIERGRMLQDILKSKTEN